jgi:hypothetical protein
VSDSLALITIVVSALPEYGMAGSFRGIRLFSSLTVVGPILVQSVMLSRFSYTYLV